MVSKPIENPQYVVEYNDFSGEWVEDETFPDMGDALSYARKEAKRVRISHRVVEVIEEFYIE